jgi:arylsulfatase A
MRLVPEKNGPKGQLYNIREDTMETQNLYFLNPEKANRLVDLMEEIIEKGHTH